jgi:hypothetical protein
MTTCINKQDAHIAIVDAYHAAHGKVMSQEESDAVLYTLNVLGGVHADCDALTRNELNDLLNFSHEAAENTEDAIEDFERVRNIARNILK